MRLHVAREKRTNDAHQHLTREQVDEIQGVLHKQTFVGRHQQPQQILGRKNRDHCRQKRRRKAIRFLLFRDVTGFLHEQQDLNEDQVFP
jgi:hypothetical protein